MPQIEIEFTDKEIYYMESKTPSLEIGETNTDILWLNEYIRGRKKFSNAFNLKGLCINLKNINEYILNHGCLYPSKRNKLCI